MSARPICQRCHRARAVCGAYCGTCDSFMRLNAKPPAPPTRASAALEAARVAVAAAAAAAAPAPPEALSPDSHVALLPSAPGTESVRAAVLRKAREG